MARLISYYYENLIYEFIIRIFLLSAYKKIKIMTRDNFEAEWPSIAEKLKNRFPKLTHIDLEYIKGREEDLLNRIQLRIGKSKNEVMTLIATL